MEQSITRHFATVYYRLLEDDGQLSTHILQLIDDEDVDADVFNLICDIFSAIIRNNWSVRMILRKCQDAKDYKATDYQRVAAKNFVSTIDFDIILTSAVCGQDNGGRAADFANLIVVIAASNETIANLMADLIHDIGYQPFDYDGVYLEG